MGTHPTDNRYNVHSFVCPMKSSYVFSKIYPLNMPTYQKIWITESLS